ncbi:MAG: GNAT family N-acetyltransferase [Pseudonocardia sp.]|nr:GNAT family N-acetyltransferase [Pseudonocardia sp.]
MPPGASARQPHGSRTAAAPPPRSFKESTVNATHEAILPVDPRTDPRWRQLAGGSGGSLFTSPPWIQAVCDSYDFIPQARIAVGDDGTPVGGFAWITVSDIRGERISSLPFCDRADPPLGSPAGWVGLADDALRAGTPLAMRCFSDCPAVADPALRVAGEAAWHGTPTNCTEEELHRRISSTSRRNLKAADRNGIQVVVSAELDAVHTFHRLHVRLRKNKYRLLAQPVEFFERIWERFSADEAVVTLLAEHDGIVVAGAMFLIWADTLYYKFGASLSEYLPMRPNDALYWAALKLAIARGLTGVDWGISDLDQPGLVSYKRKWASTERRVLTLRGGPDPTPKTEVGAMLGELTRLFTEESVPDDITTKAGALLYRHFC